MPADIYIENTISHVLQPEGRGVSMTAVLGVYCISEAVSLAAEGYTTTGLTTLGGFKGFLYMYARTIVIIESIISIRLLPAGCFDTVQWTELFPYL